MTYQADLQQSNNNHLEYVTRRSYNLRTHVPYLRYIISLCETVAALFLALWLAKSRPSAEER